MNGEAFVAKFLHGKLDERHFQKHRFVFQEIETGSRDARSPFEIDQVVLRGEIDMIERLEIELRQLTNAANFDVLLVDLADRSVRVRQVRNLHHQIVEFALDRSESFFRRRDFRSQLLTTSNQRVALLGTFRLASLLRDGLLFAP